MEEHETDYVLGIYEITTIFLHYGLLCNLCKE